MHAYLRMVPPLSWVKGPCLHWIALLFHIDFNSKHRLCCCCFYTKISRPHNACVAAQGYKGIGKDAKTVGIALEMCKKLRE